MPFPFLTGQLKVPPPSPVELPAPSRVAQAHPSGYVIDSRLLDAANVALLLSQPLLLTGEPGTGKTQFAHRLAWELGLGDPLVFNTKTTSGARDLFYAFDALGRFHAAQTGEGSSSNLDYLTYSALGTAVLWSRPRAEVDSLLPAGSVHPGARRSVVLIDEIDKAPRDFPNDLLHEVDSMSFRIPELRGVEVVADPALRPILVLTSNSEKNLPDAFLRRCIFHHIPFPDRGRLVQIVESRMASFRGHGALLDSGLDFFFEVRKLNLAKPPSTAELLNWLQALTELGATPDRAHKDFRDRIPRSLSTLAKTPADVQDVEDLARRYFA
jgi:MoxR-like ATPase